MQQHKGSLGCLFHGAERSGATARDNWIKAADRYGVLVTAPEFDEARYPSDLYQFGGMQHRRPERWAFQIIESLFDELGASEGLDVANYFLFGHSAGGQYVQRYMLMMASPRVARAVAANAGTYTMPTYLNSLLGPRFPMILDNQCLGAEALKERFGRQLVVILGQDDVDTTAAVFPRGASAIEHGVNRLERGRCIEVPGVGHGGRSMSKAAAPVLFE